MELIKSLFGETPVSISLTVAIIALIGAIVGVWHSNRKLGEVLNTKRAESKGEHDGLGKDHSNLSGKITTGNRNLEKDHGYISDQLTGIANTATYLRDEARDAKIRRENATNHELNAIKIQEQLAGYSEFVEHLKAENKELKMANLEQRKEIQELKEHINQMDEQQDNDYDLEP